MRRTALLCLPAALLVGACGSTGGTSETAATSVPAAEATTSASPPATTTAAPTTEDPLVADQALTRTLYYDYSQSSTLGVDAFSNFIAAHNHPEYVWTPEQCRQSSDALEITDSYRLSAIPDVAAMAPDTGWALPAGDQYEGLVPAGRVYILPVQFIESDVATGRDLDNTSQVHVAVVDGAAYFFVPCNIPT